MGLDLSKAALAMLGVVALRAFVNHQHKRVARKAPAVRRAARPADWAGSWAAWAVCWEAPRQAGRSPVALVS